jgi:hypothetical protein
MIASYVGEIMKINKNIFFCFISLFHPYLKTPLFKIKINKKHIYEYDNDEIHN